MFTDYARFHRFALIAFAALTIAPLHSQDSLFVVGGQWTQVPDSIHVLRLNSTSSWSEANSVVLREANVPSELIITNLDSLDHEWSLHVEGFQSADLPANSSVSIELPALPLGAYRFGLIDPQGLGLGAQGMLQVGLANSAPMPENLFHWNLCDWETDELVEWGLGNVPDLTNPYVPNYFTINERVYPNTLEDPNAVVQVNLGDTCWIAVANHGQMDHVLHFHGFHVKVLTSNLQPERIGWSKDTVPVKRGEAMTLELVVNQVGTYPVHDHNLIAVTNAGFYPGGMLTQIQVAP